MPRQKLYKIMWGDGKETLTTLPGLYAGSRTCKVFGRLDCPTGKRLMKRGNRVFFIKWEDAVEADYRPCRVCKPELVRVGDELGYDHPGFKQFLERLHVALWKSSPQPCRHQRNKAWYVCVNWEEPSEGCAYCGGQTTLSDHYSYHKALSLALRFGKILNLPIIKHSDLGSNDVVLWLPDETATKDQEALAERVKNGDVEDIYVGKHFNPEWSGVVVKSESLLGPLSVER